MINVHVEVARNISSVVVNNAKTPVNKGFTRVFNFLKKFNILQKVNFRYDFTYVFYLVDLTEKQDFGDIYGIIKTIGVIICFKNTINLKLNIIQMK